MQTAGERVPFARAAVPAFLRAIISRLRALEFGGPELSVRLALLIFGMGTLAVARTTSFVAVVPDHNLPQFPPMLWIFHLADLLWLPGGSKLPGLEAVLVVQCAALALTLIFFYLAARASVPVVLRRVRRPLIWTALPLALVLQLLMLQGILPYPLAVATQAHHYGNDAITVTSCATDEALAGHNPYVRFRVVRCLGDNALGGDRTTPLQAGSFKHIKYYPTKRQLQEQFEAAVRGNWQFPAEFESYFSYPAAAFLVPAVAVALHLHDLSVVFLLFYLAMVGLLLWRARGPARRMVLIVVAANVALWPTMTAGATDGLYALLVLVAWAGRERRWVSAIALGLAVASRQQAWFYLLFYAVLIDRTMGRREVLWRLGIVSGIFALTNLPFIVLAPGAWLTGVLGPMRDSMFARGSGLISLSLGGAGALPLGSRRLYGALELLALCGSLVLYARTCRKHPGTGLILAPVCLFFAWRSLYSYFLPLSLLALYPALVEMVQPRDADSHDRPDVPAPAGSAEAAA